MKNKKVVVGIIGILFVTACAIVFVYFRGNAAYVKVKIHSSKEYQKTMNIDYDHAYMTGTKTMNKFYITKQKHLELDKENAGYGTCEARIPLIDNHKKSKGTIQINYFKANDWFQSDIDLKINIRTIKKRQYLQIKVKLKEEGHGKKSEYGKDSDTKTIFIKRSWKLQDQPWWMIRNGENMILEDIQTKKDHRKRNLRHISARYLLCKQEYGIERTLQVMIPETAQDPDKKYPAILHVQGSAWKKQDVYKRVGVMEELAEKRILYPQSFNTVKAKIAPFPAPVEDAKTGIRFLRKNAEQFKIDPENIFLMGDSSGGNTAFITAFTADMDCMDNRCIQRIFLQSQCSYRFIWCKLCKNQRRLSNNTKSGRARQPGRIRNRQQKCLRASRII